MIHCVCGQSLVVQRVEEYEDATCFVQYECLPCDLRLGIEVDPKEAATFACQVVWTDEALHALDRLPPYVEPLVRKEVEQYARNKDVSLISFGTYTEAQNHGAVEWNAEAESRLARVPSVIRALARVELERTAIDRGMSEVTVSLMEEVKARYFGMAASAK